MKPSNHRANRVAMGNLTYREYLIVILAQGFAGNVTLKKDPFGQEQKEIANQIAEMAILTAEAIIQSEYGDY